MKYLCSINYQKFLFVKNNPLLFLIRDKLYGYEKYQYYLIVFNDKNFAKKVIYSKLMVSITVRLAVGYN